MVRPTVVLAGQQLRQREMILGEHGAERRLALLVLERGGDAHEALALACEKGRGRPVRGGKSLQLLRLEVEPLVATVERGRREVAHLDRLRGPQRKRLAETGGQILHQTPHFTAQGRIDIGQHGLDELRLLIDLQEIPSLHQFVAELRDPDGEGPEHHGNDGHGDQRQGDGNGATSGKPSVHFSRALSCDELVKGR